MIPTNTHTNKTFDDVDDNSSKHCTLASEESAGFGAVRERFSMIDKKEFLQQIKEEAPFLIDENGEYIRCPRNREEAIMRAEYSEMLRREGKTIPASQFFNDFENRFPWLKR